MTHTPTPWTVYKAKNGTYIGIGDENGEGIVDAGFGLWRAPDEALPNAEFIVKAVNAHDDLMAALKAIAECEPPNSTAKNVAETALAKAGLL